MNFFDSVPVIKCNVGTVCKAVLVECHTCAGVYYSDLTSFLVPKQ